MAGEEGAAAPSFFDSVHMVGKMQMVQMEIFCSFN